MLCHLIAVEILTSLIIICHLIAGNCVNLLLYRYVIIIDHLSPHRWRSQTIPSFFAPPEIAPAQLTAINQQSYFRFLFWAKV